MAGPPDGADALQAPHPDRCSSCGGEAMTRLPMALADGTDVIFLSCQRCESREWLTAAPDGSWTSIPIESVLARSARKPR